MQHEPQAGHQARRRAGAAAANAPIEWTPERLAEHARLTKAGVKIPELARALGCSQTAIIQMRFRLRRGKYGPAALADSGLRVIPDRAVKDRVIGLREDGKTAGVISRETGLSKGQVSGILWRAGL